MENGERNSYNTFNAVFLRMGYGGKNFHIASWRKNNILHAISVGVHGEYMPNAQVK